MNPDATEARARRTFEGFHQRPARGARRVHVAQPRVLAELGKLVAVTYATTKGGVRGHWEHHFGEEGGRRPSLAVSERGRLHIVGGSYRVEDRGIVD